MKNTILMRSAECGVRNVNPAAPDGVPPQVGNQESSKVAGSISTCSRTMNPREHGVVAMSRRGNNFSLPMNPKVDGGKSEARPHPGPLPHEREKRSQRHGETVRRMVQGFNARMDRGNLSPRPSPVGAGEGGRRPGEGRGDKTSPAERAGVRVSVKCPSKAGALSVPSVRFNLKRRERRAPTGRAMVEGLGAPRGFTLIELLVVISIMAILASFLIPVLSGVSRTKKLNVATAELNQIVTALESYKAKYGVYPPGNAYNYTGAGQTNVLYPQLYYELRGVTNKGTVFVTLDSSATINVADAPTAFGVGGFVNCSKGSGDEITAAQGFLPGLSSRQIATINANGIPITNLVTSVGGPDATYAPIPGYPNVNPFRYLYPGVNNPNTYDLWVQLQISGTKYLICNWNTAHLKNDPAP